MPLPCSLRLALCLLLIGILLSFPVRDLMADYYYRRVAYVLDDKSTEYLDVQTISANTLANYTAATGYLKKAAFLVPSRSVYYWALADIYVRLGKWAESMNAVNAPLPANVLSSKEAFENSIRYLKMAISREPANPDYHLALGQLYDETDDSGGALSEKEFAKALALAPVNASLRYAVAEQHLLADRKGDAIEQAGILAGIDDSYILPESIQKTLISERRTPAYLSRLYRSYLFKALEIAWRASKDIEVVKGIAPDNPDAKEVVQLFSEWKGIEE